jgi:CMP-N-acetylneuraminic acid synthetase
MSIGLNYLIVIPARGGSIGIPNKNLMKVHGLPLILRTFAHARYLSNQQIPICVSTDSLPILKVLCEHLKLKFELLNLKGDTIFELDDIFIHFRSPEKATSETLISENLFDIHNLFTSKYNSVQGIILLQPTSPFRSKEELRAMQKRILDVANKKTSIVSVTRVEDFHPARMYEPTKANRLRPLRGFRKSYYIRRQDLPPIFIRDGGFYVIGELFIKKSLQYSRRPTIISREFPWNINIDKLIDLELAQQVSRDLVENDASN